MGESDEIEELRREIEELRRQLKEAKKEIEDTTYYYTNVTPYIKPLIEPWEPTEEELNLLYSDPVRFIRKIIEEHEFAVSLALFLIFYLLFLFTDLLAMWLSIHP